MNCCTVRFKECIESAFQFNRKRITAREYAAQVVEFLAVKIRIARYRFKQGRYTRDIIGLFLFDELCIFLNIELRNKNACSADFKHRVYADAESETVENRHCRQHSCMTHNAVAHSRGLQSESIKVHSAELNALCDTRCSARKQYDSRFIRRHMNDIFCKIDFFSVPDKIFPEDNGSIRLVDFALFCIHQLECRGLNGAELISRRSYDNLFDRICFFNLRNF